MLAARVGVTRTEGEANVVLVRRLGKALTVPASRVSIVQGAGSRIKIVLIEGGGGTLLAGVGG